jgi:hypothetical protein
MKRRSSKVTGPFLAAEDRAQSLRDPAEEES